MILGCDALFASQVPYGSAPIPVLTGTYLIKKDSVNEMIVESNNILFNPTCSAPYQTTYELLNSDGTAADALVFNLTELWTEIGMQVTLSIETYDKNKAGEYSLLLSERESAQKLGWGKKKSKSFGLYDLLFTLIAHTLTVFLFYYRSILDHRELVSDRLLCICYD